MEEDLVHACKRENDIKKRENDIKKRENDIK